MKTLVKNGTVVTASDTFKSDVLCDDGRVVLMGEKIDAVADKTVDAAGKYVIPGGIDPHTHLDMPFGGTTSADDFESGTIAAAHGGTTSIIDFAIQYRGESLRKGLDGWHAKAEGKAAIDYGFHMIMTQVDEGRLAEMDKLVGEGVTSFKLFMAYPGVFLVDDQSIFRAMRQANKNGAVICMHAENGPAIDLIVDEAKSQGKKHPKYHSITRPSRLEGEATNRAIALAEVAEAPVYIVHLSAAEALEAVREARDRGVPALAETCPQYLFCSFEEHMDQDGFAAAGYVCSPPIRPKWHQEHLWRGLRNYELACVSTDHCPFCMKGQKELGKDDFSKVPNGMPGIETRLHLLWEGVRDGHISMNRFVEITSTAPAKIFGLHPRKGTVAVGADADLVVWDPKKELVLSHKTLHMKVDYSPFEGKKVVGAPAVVLSRGEVIVENDQFLGKAGRGRFLKRATHEARPKG
jgi:dihydropyrimidinase